jgi:DNA-directed RNA polymerase specialized sigma24 family protein
MSAILPVISGQAYGPEQFEVADLLPSIEGEASSLQRRSKTDAETLRKRERRWANKEQDWEWGANPDLWLYRERTVGILRRYMRMAMEVGRLPSLLGREFFRTRVTSYHVATFEDAVIFVHDVERSLEKLDGFSQKLLARVVLQEYTQEEAARLLGCGLRSVERRFPEALDHLSEIFLKGSVLNPLFAAKGAAEACQAVRTKKNPASYCVDKE